MRHKLPLLAISLLIGINPISATENETITIILRQIQSADVSSPWVHPTGTATIQLNGTDVSVFRWIVSAKNEAAVSARVVNGRWLAYDADPPVWQPQEQVDIHSAQVWFDTRVVIVDIFPWRQRNGRWEILVGGSVEMTINHSGVTQLRPKASHPLEHVLANAARVVAPKSPTPIRKSVPILEAGSWLKIPILSDGVYQITGNYINASGISGAIAANLIRIYAPNHMGRPLPDALSAPEEANLVELPIQIIDGGDGILDFDDDIFFYAQGPSGFDFDNGIPNYIQNPYTETAYVWLHVSTAAFGIPSRMATGPALGSPGESITKGRHAVRHEIDLINGYESGPIWHEATITNGTSYSTTITTPQLLPEEPMTMKVHFRGGDPSLSHRVRISLNGTEVATSAVWNRHDTLTVIPDESEVRSSILSGINSILIENASFSSSSKEQVWFDWTEFQYGINLVATDDALAFTDVIGSSDAELIISGFLNEPTVYDITEPSQPVKMILSSFADSWHFRPIDRLIARRYYATAGVITVTSGGVTENLDFNSLRNPTLQADYIIITHPSLRRAADKLAAIHSTEVHSSIQLTTIVTEVDDIYREFSGGVSDPYAIRAFLRYAANHWQAPAPKLVALFGDGDFDYRNITGRSNNLVPTIQVDGDSEIESRAADDRFVYIDTSYSTVALPGMGIGRIAVANLSDAEDVVEVIRDYAVNPEPGAWRKRVLLAADDPVRPNNRETSFVSDTELLANSLPAFIQFEKIYLTEYPEALDPATNSVVKPGATRDMLAVINRGVALINYIGHGSATQWAQEGLLKMERDRRLLDQGMRLPIWIAGTCTWGRFDHVDIPSMSEVLTASSEMGAIAVISAVRAVYSTANTAFVRRLFAQAFPDSLPSTERLGTILQLAKAGDEKFLLFGDPALFTVFPKGTLTISSVTPDTLQVLGTAGYSGTTAGGIVDGEALVTVVDAPRQVDRTYRDMTGNLDTLSYSLPGSVLFRGPVRVLSSQFEGEFILPKDINYSGNPVKIIAHAWSSESGFLKEQIGYRNDLLISGTAQIPPDSVGPIISLAWDGMAIQSGEVLPQGTQIDIRLQDPLGINITGETGHAIRVWLDEESDAVNLVAAFEYDMGSHTAGEFSYVLDPELTGGHDFYVEAWDGANNKSVKNTRIYLDLAATLDVTDILNYPNPFQASTQFVYTLSVPAEITVTVYTLNGVKIVELSSFGEQGAGFRRLPWDGLDAFGDEIANGTYLYRLEAETMDGATITRWGKVARLK